MFSARRTQLCSLSWVPAEEALHLVEALGQPIDVLAVGVNVEAGPRAGLLAEPLVERHRAVVAGTDGDRLAIEQRRDVVRMRVGAG